MLDDIFVWITTSEVISHHLCFYVTSDLNADTEISYLREEPLCASFMSVCNEKKSRFKNIHYFRWSIDPKNTLRWN